MTTAGFQAALDDVWRLLPGPSDQSTTVSFSSSPEFASAFDVDTAAAVSVGAALRAARELGRGQSDRPPSLAAEVHGSRVRAAFTGPLRVDDEPVPKWADLSGYFRTADDRAIQFHANFDHHAAGIVRRLGCEPTRESVAAATATWQADDLEAALVSDGMIGAKLRTLDEWQQHPHAVATAHLPLVSIEQIGDAAPHDRTGDRDPSGDGPCGGMRVLDCSRVLAGPVCGQTLAGLGADVLRVGSSDLPSVPVCVMSTGFGKRNAFVDLGTTAGRETFSGLLADANIWVDAFRPGALANHGFSPEHVAERHPGIVVVQLSAFDWTGPWAGRRGFDSIVQSTTGVVDAGTRAAGRHLPGDPTPLPVQALDYATGYLAAAAAMRVAQHQATDGGSWLVRLSLLRTRNWLVGLRPPATFAPATPTVEDADLVTVESAFGRVTAARPVFGAPASAPRPLGSSEPVWRSR